MPKKKRANGAGSSIRKRSDGRYECSATIGGKRTYFYGKTSAEAAQKQRKALAAADQGQYVAPDQMTVAAWLAHWERTYGRPAWRDTTASTHHQSIVVHLVPALGEIPMQKLCADDIQRFIVQQQAQGAKPASIIKRLSPLKSAMRQAVLLKKRLDDPFMGVKQPKLTQDEIEYLTEDEQRAYAAALPDTTAGRLLRFILGTGLRIGEALALCWSDIEDTRFTVRRTIATVSNLEAAEGEPRTRQSMHPTKTGAGLRVIPLGTDMRRLLDKQHKAQAAERLKAGSLWGHMPDGIVLPAGLVFASAVGTPLQVRNVRRVHERVLEAAGVDCVTLHGLRHSFATRWVANDNDVRGLSEILGHADVATTLRRYVHSDPTHKTDMMQRMGVL